MRTQFNAKRGYAAILCFVAFAAASLAAHAASPQTYMDYSGLYGLIGHDIAPTSNLVRNYLAHSDFDGVSIRTGWDNIEPAEDNYDWSYIDEMIARARSYGKRIMIRVRPAWETPSWVYDAGAEDFWYIEKNDNDNYDRMPVPWDPVYQEKWGNFIADFGARYDSNPDVVQVLITGCTRSDCEMYLPSDANDKLLWAEKGYSPERIIGAWKWVIDAWVAALPHKMLSISPSTVIYSDGVTEAVSDYCAQTYPWKIGQKVSFWHDHNDTGYYPLAAMMKNVDDFTHGGLEPVGAIADMEQAIADGISWHSVFWVEPYTRDLSSMRVEMDKHIALVSSSAFYAVDGQEAQTQLTWRNPSGYAGFAGVKIARKVGSYPLGADDPAADVVYEGQAESYLDTGLLGGIKYYYTMYDSATGYVLGQDTVIAAAASGEEQTLEFLPSDDCFSTKQNDFQHGATADIRLSASATNPNYSFLKFTVESPETNSAKLRLYCLATAGNTSVYAVENDSWAEMTLKWTNQPALGELIGVIPTPAVNTWVEVDVSSYVTAGGVYSFGLTSDAVAQTKYASKEGGNPAVLQVAFGGGQPSSEPVTLGPSDDTFSTISTPTSPRGTADALYLDCAGNLRNSFVKFQVDIEEVESATLRLLCKDSGVNARLYAVEDNSWTEGALTWNNQPTMGELLGTVDGVTNGVWAEWDVSAYVTGAGQYSFGLMSDDTDQVKFSSKEGTDAPQLVVTPAAAPQITPPAAPEGLVAVAGDRQAALDWDDNGEADLLGYNVYRTTTPGAGYFPVNGVLLSQSDYVDLNVADSNTTTYYYMVSAVNQAGQESLFAGDASATPHDMTPPASVTNVMAESGDEEVELAWTNPADEDLAGVRIQRSTVDCPAAPDEGDTVYDGLEQSYTDTGLENGVTYYYSAFAYDEYPNYSEGVSVSAIPNGAPEFVSQTIAKPAAIAGEAYEGQSLAGDAMDDACDTLTFAKVSGPEWLSVAEDGTLSGTPTNYDAGANAFEVSVTDNYGLSAEATLVVPVKTSFALYAYSMLNVCSQASVSGGVATQAGVTIVSADALVAGDVFSNSVSVESHASVTGTAVYNTLSLASEASVGAEMTPLALPVGDPSPVFPAFAPGYADISLGVEDVVLDADDIGLRNKETLQLAAGNYGVISLKAQSVLALEGGIYNIRSLNVDGQAAIVCLAPTEIRVAEGLDIKAYGTISPAAGLNAGDVTVFVAGNVVLGAQSATQARIYAPNGLVDVSAQASVTGVLVGRNVSVGSQTVVVFE